MVRATALIMTAAITTVIAMTYRLSIDVPVPDSGSDSNEADGDGHSSSVIIRELTAASYSNY